MISSSPILTQEGKIIIVYGEDEMLYSTAATTMVQRGIENLFVLSGGTSQGGRRKRVAEMKKEDISIFTFCGCDLCCSCGLCCGSVSVLWLGLVPFTVTQRSSTRGNVLCISTANAEKIQREGRQEEGGKSERYRGNEARTCLSCSVVSLPSVTHLLLPMYCLVLFFLLRLLVSHRSACHG